MRDRFSSLVATALLATAAATLPAQMQGQALPTGRLFQARAHDLPTLVAAIQKGRTGKLLADPEVEKAVQTAIAAYLQDIQPWLDATDFLVRTAPRMTSAELRFERALHRIDWRDLQDLDLSAIQPKANDNDPDAQFRDQELAFGLRATDAGKVRIDALFDEVVQAMRTTPPMGLGAAASQNVLGQPGLRLDPQATQGQTDFWGMAQPGHLWALRTATALTCGSGADAFAVPMPTGDPHVAIGMSPMLYVRMMFYMLMGEQGQQDALEAIGIDNATWIEWRLGTNGELLQDDISVQFDGDPHGLIGALLLSMAPLPPQPLPDGALLQLRCGFELDRLMRAVDTLLGKADLQTLAEMHVREDLERAWTGGMAFAVARPAPGGVVPRLYASFGITDEAALGRLLDLLKAAPFVKTTPRKVGEREVTMIALEGLPPALQPCYCVDRGTLHIAESFQSLKAQLAAIDAGGKPAMDVGRSPKPQGAGTTMPGMELRYDAPAIQLALQQVWLPLAALAGAGSKPYLALQQMPEADLVAESLVPGRAVLRRDGTTYSLCSTGTLGGPFLQALTTAFGPLMTQQFTSQRQYTLSMVQGAIANAQVTALHVAIAAFEQKEKRRPVSLGELRAAGLVRDDDLVLPGDTTAEALTHDGKEVGKTSYRYYAQPIKVSPDGEEITAELVQIQKLNWWRFAMDTAGTLHVGYGEFAEATIADIEKKAHGH